MITINFEKFNDNELCKLEDVVVCWLVANIKTTEPYNKIIFLIIEEIHDEILREMEERRIIEIP